MTPIHCHSGKLSIGREEPKYRSYQSQQRGCDVPALFHASPLRPRKQRPPMVEVRKRRRQIRSAFAAGALVASIPAMAISAETGPLANGFDLARRCESNDSTEKLFCVTF